MVKTVKDFFVIIFASCCFLVSIVMLPWAELGFSGQFPPWLDWLMKPLGIAQFMEQIPGAKAIEDYLAKQGATTSYGDYAYALFLFVAMTVAAIAIVLIGREDAEEKTVLPVKK